MKFTLALALSYSNLYIDLKYFLNSHKEQAVAELGQTQVKLEVVNDVVVKVRI